MRKLIEAQIKDITQKISINNESLKKNIEKHIQHEGMDSSVILQLKNLSQNAEALNSFHSNLCEQLEKLDYQERKGEYEETYYPEN